MAADVAAAVGPLQIGLGGDYGGIAIDADFEVAEIHQRDLQAAGTVGGQDIGLGLKRAIGANAEIIIGKQTVDDGNIIVDQSIAPF